MRIERLQKVMAKAGVASRRRAEEMILRGLVKVDGKVVREMGVKVDPAVNRIEVRGEVINIDSARRYLILNKPKGYLTTVADPFGRPTVMKLLPEGEKNLFPVGRLDLNSEGLLLLTNDGESAFRLTHPSHKIAKTYIVAIRGLPKNNTVWRLRQGVKLEDGRTRPATVRISRRYSDATVLEIKISEGRKRQIRRMCQAVGHPVISLKRVSIGPIKLGELKPGKTRYLSKNEIADLKQAVGIERE